MFGGTNGLELVRKLGKVTKETLKNGLAGWVATVAVTREKRSTTEFVLTRSLELGPAVGAGLASTCIRTVCPANTCVSEAKSARSQGDDARRAVKPLGLAATPGGAPRVA